MWGRLYDSEVLISPLLLTLPDLMGVCKASSYCLSCLSKPRLGNTEGLPFLTKVMASLKVLFSLCITYDMTSVELYFRTGILLRCRLRSGLGYCHFWYFSQQFRRSDRNVLIYFPVCYPEGGRRCVGWVSWWRYVPYLWLQWWLILMRSTCFDIFVG